MTKSDPEIQNLVSTLEERAKELDCLYQVEEALHRPDAKVKDVLELIVHAIPAGMQYPELCRVRLSLGDFHSQLEGYSHKLPGYKVNILAQEVKVGSLNVCYIRVTPKADQGPFLKQEIRLINTIADLVGHFHFHQQLKQMSQAAAAVKENLDAVTGSGWRIVLNLIKKTDTDLFLRISRRMNNLLCWEGIQEAEAVLERFGLDRRSRYRMTETGDNQPIQRSHVDMTALGDEIFEIAARYLPDDEILLHVQKWVLENKSHFLVQTIVNPDASHMDVFEAIRRFNLLAPTGVELSESARKSITVALISRFLSSQLEFIKIAKNYVDINDFYELIQQLIIAPGSRGALGGKGAGLFLAYRIIRRMCELHPELSEIKVPKTWYITADGMYNFLHHNNIEEITEQKYKPIEQVQREYPNIIHTFKNSYFPPDMIRGLSMALDDFGDSPLIVRSSSLLEDRFGATFSGKYLSLFLANQGTKEARLEALMDAISEVYASVYNSDPIQYRSERGLLDFNEEMAVLIQEVVGTKVGKYYLPTFAGVAFSNNDFRWSPRIKRDDGLVRLAVGLGTRAVDRLSDDYTVLVAPGQPSLHVNITPDEKIRYSPKKLDLINLETNSFETVDLREFLKKYGTQLPGVWDLVSVLRDGHIRQGSAFTVNFDLDTVCITFDGLFSKSPFLKQMKLLLNQLQERLGVAVDIEFASDGRDFYLLQCRPQGHSPDSNPAVIPKEIPLESILFTARKYVSNGTVPEIEYLVYVSPQKYAEIDSLDKLIEIGRVVGRLNSILPKRKFILIGPGRWGSRGDIKLGVSVTYSDINNTAMLIEVGRKMGNYVPDLSFGTHFFQDLVEAQIRYLPLYPDDKDTEFYEEFFDLAQNALSRLIPEAADLEDCVRVIYIPDSTGGKILKVLMNADQELAVGMFAPPFGG